MLTPERRGTGAVDSWALLVMTLAMAYGLTVISLEVRATQHSKKRPKIPNVCEEFGISCVTLSGFLGKKGFGSGS